MIQPGTSAYYDMSLWRIALYTADGIIAVVCAAMVLWCIVRQIDEKKPPDRYKD